MNRQGIGVRNTVLIILCVVLAALLAGMMYVSKQSEKAKEAEAEELKAQAKQYEDELAQIRGDLSVREKSITYDSDTAEVMVGFLISEENDIDYIKSVAEEFYFRPVLIVDCKGDLSNVKTLIHAASGTGWEIMLTATSFSESINANVVEVLSYMKSIDAKDSGVFLIRNDSYTNKNVQLLIDDGFIGYTKYNQTTPAAGVTDDGYVYFDYSYLQSMKTSVADRLYSLCANKTALIVVFDMKSMHSGDVTEDYAARLLELLKEYEENGQCQIASVEEVVLELSGANATEEERRANYEEYAAEQQPRIDELEKMIREIYSQMG